MRHVAMQEISLSVCGDAWFNLCTLMTECETGVQQTRPVAVALTIIHTQYTFRKV